MVGAATIDQLPGSLLGTIFARVGKHRAAAGLLVSKRWHRVFLSEPALWREFSLSHVATAGRLASELTLLRRVGGLVAVLQVPELNLEALAAALAAAQPGRLRELAISASSWQQVAAVARLFSLSKLEIELKQPAGLGAALPHLPYLSSLNLSSGSAKMRQADLAGIMAATQLTELVLQMGSYEQPVALSQLTCLSRLRKLHLTAQKGAAQVNPPQPALLPALTSFLFQSDVLGLSDTSGVQVADCAVRSCEFAPIFAGTADGQDGAAALLTIEQCVPKDGWPALLTALRPGSVPAVQALQLLSCRLDPAAVLQCTALATVTRLLLQQCGATASDWEAGLDALLWQAPQLSSLHVDRCFGGAFPAWQAAFTGLHHLSLAANRLRTLPGGAYLSSLERLSLHDRKLEGLPLALAAATALTSLEVQIDEYNEAPPIPADSVGAVLSHMQRLQVLQLTNCGLEQLPADCWAGMSALQSLDLRSNSLTALPMALQQATALRQLNFSYNEMAPTAQHLGALLSRLPLLEGLDLTSVGLTELPEHLPPGLRSLRVGYNQLHSLPAGLAAATLLSQLSMECNPPLSLTRTQLDSLLAHLPSLRRLQVWGTGIPEQLQKHAAQVVSLRGD